MVFAAHPDYAKNLASFFTESITFKAPASEEYFQRLKTLKEKTDTSIHFMDKVLE